MARARPHATGYRLTGAARLARVPTSRARHYVEIGLVTPALIEDGTSYFGDAELARFRRIRRLHDDLGLNSAGVEVVLRLLDQIEALRNELRQRRT